MSTYRYYITNSDVIPSAVLSAPIVTISPIAVLLNNLYNTWGIPPIAVLWAPIVTTLPTAVLYQVLYYEHLLLLHYR